jgi:hypothetical protein
MPTISTFYGILIQMFWKDHAPPHFHALYAEEEALFDIRTSSKDAFHDARWCWCSNGRKNIAPNSWRIGNCVPTTALRKRFPLFHNPSHPATDAMARHRGSPPLELSIARSVR